MFHVFSENNQLELLELTYYKLIILKQPYHYLHTTLIWQECFTATKGSPLEMTHPSEELFHHVCSWGTTVPFLNLNFFLFPWLCGMGEACVMHSGGELQTVNSLSSTMSPPSASPTTSAWLVHSISTGVLSPITEEDDSFCVAASVTGRLHAGCESCPNWSAWDLEKSFSTSFCFFFSILRETVHHGSLRRCITSHTHLIIKNRVVIVSTTKGEWPVFSSISNIV